MAARPVTDIHAHVLPGVDDGPLDEQATASLLRAFRSAGTHRVFCTSHFLSPHFDVTLDALATGFRKMNALWAEMDGGAEGTPSLGDPGSTRSPSASGPADGTGAPGGDGTGGPGAGWPDLALGAEVHLSKDVEAHLRNGTVPTLGSTRYVLAELPSYHTPGWLEAALRYLHELRVRNFQPILAHPERYVYFQKHPDAIDQVTAAGAVLQLTAHCFDGTLSDNHVAAQVAWRWLCEGRTALIGSDAHNTTSRPPGLLRAYERIADRLGDAAAETLMDNANAVWYGEAPVELAPVAAGRASKADSGRTAPGTSSSAEVDRISRPGRAWWRRFR